MLPCWLLAKFRIHITPNFDDSAFLSAIAGVASSAFILDLRPLKHANHPELGSLREFWTIATERWCISSEGKDARNTLHDDGPALRSVHHEAKCT